MILLWGESRICRQQSTAVRSSVLSNPTFSADFYLQNFRANFWIKKADPDSGRHQIDTSRLVALTDQGDTETSYRNKDRRILLRLTYSVYLAVLGLRLYLKGIEEAISTAKTLTILLWQIGQVSKCRGYEVESSIVRIPE